MTSYGAEFRSGRSSGMDEEIEAYEWRWFGLARASKAQTCRIRNQKTMAMLSKISSILLPALSPQPKLIYHATLFSYSTCRARTSAISTTKKKKNAKLALAKEKRRTRSDKEFDRDAIIERCYGEDNKNDNNTRHHIPVLLAEVLDVFANSPLTSFVDCTLGAAGHSTAVSLYRYLISLHFFYFLL
jgi:hypothetical protein